MMRGIGHHFAWSLKIFDDWMISQSNIYIYLIYAATVNQSKRANRRLLCTSMCSCNKPVYLFSPRAFMQNTAMKTCTVIPIFNDSNKLHACFSPFISDFTSQCEITPDVCILLLYIQTPNSGSLLSLCSHTHTDLMVLASGHMAASLYISLSHPPFLSPLLST